MRTPINLWGVTTNFVHLDAYHELNLCGERCCLIGDMLDSDMFYNLLYLPAYAVIVDRYRADEERRRTAHMIDAGILQMRIARPITMLDQKRRVMAIYIAFPPMGVSWDEAWAAGATLRALDAT